MKLQDWISSLYVKQTFSDLPDEWIQTDTPYREVKELYPFIEFVVNKGTLFLITLSWDEPLESLGEAILSIKRLLGLSKTSRKNTRFKQVADSQSHIGSSDTQTRQTHNVEFQSHGGSKEFGESQMQSTGLAEKTLDHSFPWSQSDDVNIKGISSSSLRQDEERIECPNLFLGWVLSEMECESNSDINIQFDRQSRIIVLNGKGEAMNDWCSAMGDECTHVSNTNTIISNIFSHVSTIHAFQKFQCSQI